VAKKLLFFATILLSVQFMLSAEEKIPECMLNYKFGKEQYTLVVDKMSQTLYVYSNYSPEPLEKIIITSGKKSGRKMFEGDLKTPEGIYFFTRILNGEELPTYDDYGDKAFTMNYPNPIDKMEKRNGSGIWLHGAHDPSKTTSPTNSRGCVVMKNSDLMKISRYIFVTQTPIIIYNKIVYDTPENIVKRRNKVINHIRFWKESWEEKRIDDYIGCYIDSFKYKGKSLNWFRTYKNNLNKSYKFIRVFLSNVQLVGFKNYFTSMFNQLYISDRNHFYSKKLQYWKFFNTSKPSLIAEKSYPLPGISRFELKKGNYVNIDEYRRSVLTNQQKSLIKLNPSTIYVKELNLSDSSVKLTLDRTGQLYSASVIPVFSFNRKGEQIFRSISGVPLSGGIPSNYAKSVKMRNRNLKIEVPREKDEKVRSLTVFIIRNNTIAQIITYFMDKK